MTPRDYIRHLEHLVAAGDDRGSLAFSSQHHPSVARQLSDEELQHVGGLLEGASMALDLTDVTGVTGVTRGDVSTVAGTTGATARATVRGAGV